MALLRSLGGVMPKSDYITDSPEVAYEWLIQGKILAYPTESVWGLGCDAFNQKAVDELLVLKNRPAHKGLIVLTATDSLVQDFLNTVPKLRQDDIVRSWQNSKGQATTWLFDIPDGIVVPQNVRGEHTSLAIRLIKQGQINELCILLAMNDNANPFGFLVSTSCNLNGEPPAKDFDAAHAYFGDKVCYLVGETLNFDKPSQIKNAKTGKLVRM